MNQDKHLVPVYIMEIMRKHSGEANPLSHDKVRKYLASEYAIEMDRTAVSRNINKLVSAGLIISNGKKRGCYFDDREFDDSELKLLIRSVMCNSAIPGFQVKDLIGRIGRLGGDSFDSGEYYVGQADKWQRSDNQELFQNIEEIDAAIMNNVQIRFDYYVYGVDKKLHRSGVYVVSPYNIILQDQQYYLMATDEKRKVMSFYRIHRIRNIERLEEKMSPFSETAGYEVDPDLGRVYAEAPYRLLSEPVMITFRAGRYMLDDVIERFGTDILVSKEAEDTHAVVVSVRSDPREMELWALQHLESVEVLAPGSLRDTIHWIVHLGSKKYGHEGPEIRFNTHCK